MKTIVQRFFILIFALLGAVYVFATPHPPSPAAKTTAGPTGPPGLIIDKNILVFLLIAILFGIYIVYKYQFKDKGSNLKG